LLDLRLTGGVSHSPLPTRQWLKPQDGFIATVTTADQFKVAQVNWLSESGKQRVIANLNSASR
jgi:hypothetical protein